MQHVGRTVRRLLLANRNHRRQTEGQHAQDQIRDSEHVTQPPQQQLVHQVRLETMLIILAFYLAELYAQARYELKIGASQL